jgi:hypothetical protein
MPGPPPGDNAAHDSQRLHAAAEHAQRLQARPAVSNASSTPCQALSKRWKAGYRARRGLCLDSAMWPRLLVVSVRSQRIGTPPVPATLAPDTAA